MIGMQAGDGAIILDTQQQIAAADRRLRCLPKKLSRQVIPDQAGTCCRF
ncbi:hypothetical protein [Thiolapillus sp.]